MELLYPDKCEKVIAACYQSDSIVKTFYTAVHVFYTVIHDCMAW